MGDTNSAVDESVIMSGEGRASGRVPAARLINEYEAQHFGFSPKGFTDCVYNVILEKWSDVVSNVLYPGLVEIGLGDLTIEQKCELKTRLVSVICKKDMIGALMKKMEEYTLRYKFRIPDNVTLPSDQCNLLVNEKIDEEAEIEGRIKTLKEEIIDIRMAKKVVDDEITLTEGILKILKEIHEGDQESNEC